MSKIRAKGISSYRDRHGRVRWRFRRKGYQCSLPDKDSPEFWEAYSKAIRDFETGGRASHRARIAHGSIRALFVSYLESRQFAQLKDATRIPRRRIIDRFVGELGKFQANDLTQVHIAKLLRKMEATPAAANELLKVLRVVFDYGLAEGIVTSNPTNGVKKLKSSSSGYHTWTEGEIQMFSETYPSGSKERLALELFLGTGQRVSDIAGLGWQHIDGHTIRLKQQKTGSLVVIPITAPLLKELSYLSRSELSFLVSNKGKPYSVKSLSQWFVTRARACGLPKGCSPHGLRKAAARRLAEAGCTPHEIASITGHRSLSEVTRYARDADRIRLGRSALKKLDESMDREQKLANLDLEFAKNIYNTQKGLKK